MSVRALLNKTCTIRRSSSSVSSTSAGKILTWSDASTAVPCSVQVDNQAERDIGKRETGVVNYKVYFQASTDVRTGDLLTTITGLTSVVLEVTSPPTDGVGRTTYTKVTAQHRQGFGQTVA